jgi:hypothetical protein
LHPLASNELAAAAMPERRSVAVSQEEGFCATRRAGDRANVV